MFGLAPSPLLLGGVSQQHLELWRPHLLEAVSEALTSMYVDDFISGAPTVIDSKKLRGYVRKNQTKMENSGKNVKTQNRSNSGY